MQLTRHKASSSGDNSITFPGLESWNPATEVATMAADVNKQRALCRISLKTLRDKFGVGEEGPMRSLAEHRGVIQAAAKKLIENDDYQEDGSVLIRARDL